jgi:hypothetical protein
MASATTGNIRALTHWISTVLQSTGPGESVLRVWIASMEQAAMAMTLVTGLWVTWLSSRVHGPENGPRRVAFSLQFARTWDDVSRALGHRGHRCRTDLKTALRADFVFIGAYTLLAVTVGASFVAAGNSWGALIAVFGVAAGFCDVAENRAMMQLLGGTKPAGTTPGEPLAAPPYPWAIAKWTAVALAVVAGVVT